MSRRRSVPVPKGWGLPPRMPPGQHVQDAMGQPMSQPASQAQGQYGEFRASLLYCPTCRQATPTRERLLLVLPTGNLYEYLCTECGTSTGSKTDVAHQEARLFVP